MRLFVGNVTAQTHEFLYRLIEQTKILRQVIAPGRQIQIAGDLDRADLDYIVGQHAKYGMIPADEISYTKRFHGLCYSIDKPITTALLNYLREHNQGELVEQGRELRRVAAIVSNDLLETALRENGRPEQITQFEMTIQEDREIDSDLPQLSEGLRVIRNPNPPVAPKRRGRKAA